MRQGFPRRAGQVPHRGRVLTTPTGGGRRPRSGTTAATTARQPQKGTKMTGAATPKNDLLNRLNRIEGQVRGIAKMIEQDKYWIDIPTKAQAHR